MRSCHARGAADAKFEKSQRWIGIDDGTVAFLQEWRRICLHAIFCGKLDYFILTVNNKEYL